MAPSISIATSHQQQQLQNQLQAQIQAYEAQQYQQLQHQLQAQIQAYQTQQQQQEVIMLDIVCPIIMHPPQKLRISQVSLKFLQNHYYLGKKAS